MISLEPIGVAHTPFSSSCRIPRQGGGPASVEVFEAFAPALDGLDFDSHVWILGWFDSASRITQARGRNAPDHVVPRGVFSMRSPARPNPIALTPARLLRREGRVLHLDRLDFHDGTPVLDIKPYSPGWDLIPCATSGHRYDPARYTPEELALALTRDAANALGDSGSSAALTEGLARLAIDAALPLRDSRVSFEVGALDGRIEVLLCATGATFGNGRLRLASAANDVILTATDSELERWEVRKQGDSVTIARVSQAALP